MARLLVTALLMIAAGAAAFLSGALGAQRPHRPMRANAGISQTLIDRGAASLVTALWAPQLRAWQSAWALEHRPTTALHWHAQPLPNGAALVSLGIHRRNTSLTTLATWRTNVPLNRTPSASEAQRTPQARPTNALAYRLTHFPAQPTAARRVPSEIEGMILAARPAPRHTSEIAFLIEPATEQQLDLSVGGHFRWGLLRTITRLTAHDARQIMNLRVNSPFHRTGPSSSYGHHDALTRIDPRVLRELVATGPQPATISWPPDHTPTVQALSGHIALTVSLTGRTPA